jgi:hypothetical protein
VRAVESTDPRALTSARCIWRATPVTSRVYRCDVNVGGGPGSPSWTPVRSSSGVTNPIHELTRVFRAPF